MRWMTPGLVLGVGLRGFADGIVLHQIAQWHNMGSAVLPPVTMSRNMRWDGLFHLATWTITVIGVFMLWHTPRVSVRSASMSGFVGELLFGWGAFNLVEGVVDHHVLQLHHVRDLPVHMPTYDWLFLGLGGVGLLATGWALMRLGDERTSGVR